MKYRRCRANCSGQGLIEGTFGLTMVVGGGLLATLFVFNSGFGTLYQTKLSMVTSQAAAVAAQLPDDDATRTVEIQSFVQQLMPNVGLSPNNLSVTTTTFSAANGQVGALVSVSSGFPILGGGTFVPTSMQVSDTEYVWGGNQ